MKIETELQIGWCHLACGVQVPITHKIVTDEDLDDIEWAVVISKYDYDEEPEHLIVKTTDGKIFNYRHYNIGNHKTDISFLSGWTFNGHIRKSYKVDLEDMCISNDGYNQYTLWFNPSPEWKANKRLEKELGLKESKGRYYISDDAYIVASESCIDTKSDTPCYLFVKRYPESDNFHECYFLEGISDVALEIERIKRKEGNRQCCQQL